MGLALTSKQLLAVTAAIEVAIGTWPVGVGSAITAGAFATWLAKGMPAVMRDKQRQWDTWLKAEWNDADSADVKAKADVLFSDYVHDSRAWFKALVCSDGTGMAPNDEDWFVFGDRYKAKPGRITLLEEKAEKYKKSGDEESRKAAEHELQQLKKGGIPFIHGGREPYRMWGYVRHRKIYESGVIRDSGYSSRQDAIEREEADRVREQRRTKRLADEKDLYDKEVNDIKAEDKKYRDGPKKTSAQKGEATRYYKGRIERADRSYKEALARIEKDTAATVE